MRALAPLLLPALIAACSDEPTHPGTGGSPPISTVSSSSSSASSSSGGDAGPCATCAEAFLHPFEGPLVCGGEAAALDALRKCACSACALDCGPFCTEAVPSGEDLCVTCIGANCSEQADACPGL
jgi:hypothetical protein